MLDVVRSILLFSWRKTDFVVFVRYLMGTAYLPSPLNAVAYNFFSKLVPKSNAMFFLDVAPTIAAARMKSRSETEMFESLASLKKVRGKALALTRFDGWQILDSNQGASEVAGALQKKLFGD
jgi:dTMP kinase